MLAIVILAACGRVGFDETGPDAAAVDDELVATEGCATCGDADGSGDFDADDVAVVALHVAGTGALPCPIGADTNLDGAVTRRDLHALVFRVTGRATGSCEACERACGDLDGDGAVDGEDSLALDVILAAPEVLDGCLAWAADANGDGSLDVDDSAALAELRITGIARCAP